MLGINEPIMCYTNSKTGDKTFSTNCYFDDAWYVTDENPDNEEEINNNLAGHSPFQIIKECRETDTQAQIKFLNEPSSQGTEEPDKVGVGWV